MPFKIVRNDITKVKADMLPGQRPYKDAAQLYSYCNKEKELPEQSGDRRHICTEQF